MAAIGEVIDDKYEILKLIGRGGMSRVYLAMDKRLNKQWAVKEIEKRAKDKNNEVVIQSAVAEANMIKKLDHPALPRIVDIIDNGNVICVVMDYIEGEPLSKILETEGAQPEDAVIEWAKQLCEVLDYLHTRKPPIIYRDMKPANIMLKPDGTVKLIDFGIAREYKEHNLSDTVNMGTKGYAAPEQFGNAGQTDARTDVYCLGVTLYHLVTGHNPAEPPYEIYPIRHWDPQLSAGLEVIIQKCVQPNPDDRYQSCAELMYALQHYEEYGEEYRSAQKTKLRTFIATAAASVLCLGLGFMMMGIRSNVNNNDFLLKLEEAKNMPSTNKEEKIDKFKEAIDIIPSDLSAYTQLVEFFSDDSVFDDEEATELMKIISTRKNILIEQPEYYKLAYSIGRLYWFYYDIDNMESNNGKTASVTWFEDVLDYAPGGTKESKNADIYYHIGYFIKEINQKQRTEEDQGLYREQWGYLEQMVQNAEDDNSTAQMQLEVCKIVMNAIENYSRQFKNEGVEQERMQSLYDEVCLILDDVNISDDENSTTYKLKEYIDSRKEETQSKIKDAYKSKDKDAKSDKNDKEK